MSSGCFALIVEPRQTGRTMLKEALAAITQLRGTTCVSTLDQARALIESEKPFELVFLSDRLTQEEVTAFITESKASRKGRDAAYVRLFTAAASIAAVRTGLLQGSDGFLVEPYSVAALKEIIALAERVKKERRAARVAGAMRLLIEELRYQVDQLAMLQRAGQQGNVSRQVFAEMCSVLREFEPDLLEVYFDQVLECFGSATHELSLKRRGRTYSGASRRVREKVAAQALREIKMAFAG